MPVAQAAPLRYSPLEEYSIRLLFPAPQKSKSSPVSWLLEHHHLSALPRYAALSYCWGSSAKTASVRINDQLVPITQGLASALQDLADASNEGRDHVDPRVNHLWIDAVCIDQSNRKERDEQVALMRDTFHYANIVLAYLGPEGKETRAAFKAVNGRIPQQEDYTKVAPRGYKRAAASSRRWSPEDEVGVVLLQSEYWSRTWIVQEFLVGLSVLLYSGRSNAWGQQLMVYLQHRSQFHRDEASMRVLRLCLLSGSMEALGAKSGDECNLGELLADNSYDTLCRDPRDKVIALKGLHTCDRAARFKNSRRSEILRPLLIGYEQTTKEVVIATKTHLEGAGIQWRGNRLEEVFDGMARQAAM